MKQYKTEIDALAYLYNQNDAGMKQQNINNWGYCLNENIVRGIVIALFRQHKTPRDTKKQVAQEILNDFIYAEDIGNLISEKYLKWFTILPKHPVIMEKENITVIRA